VSRQCWETVGGLDMQTFGRYGWGIDLDLALRARKAGYGLYTTEMAYINHFGGKGGNLAMFRGLRSTHGSRATAAMVRELGIAHSRSTSRSIPLDCSVHHLDG
jgi:GT2 family glycosyltransferase